MQNWCVNGNEGEIGSSFGGKTMLCTLYKFGHPSLFVFVHNAPFGRFVAIPSFLIFKKSQESA
jgi:hypothetical protein